MMGKGFKLGQSRWSAIKGLSVLGAGAFLLGAALPVAAVIGNRFNPNRLSQPELMASTLAELGTHPGVEAFPRAVDSSRVCRSTARFLQEQPVTGEVKSSSNVGNGPFQGAALQQATIAFNPDQFQRLAGAHWPQIHEQARLARVPILMYHDVLSEPEVFFDLVPEQFESQLQLLLESGFTPVTLDQVVQHLRTGLPLPEKPVVLSFDDGYAGHYDHVFKLLQKYNVPGVFSIFPGKVDGDIVGRSTLTWEQLKTMAADPLVTIASHSVTHPLDLTQMSDDEIAYEVTASKARLEEQLGIPIKYFTYPAGHYDERVANAVADAGYLAGLTMRQTNEQFAGASESLLAIERLGQSNLDWLLDQAWGGTLETTEDSELAATTESNIGVPNSAVVPGTFDFAAPVGVQQLTLEDIPLALITGGRPVTIHADSRYQLPEILDGTNAIAGVDGGFFSLEYLDSNVMIGPVLSQSSRRFVPGNASENPRLNGRPLVLIGPDEVKFLPFSADRHNTLAGMQQALPQVTDAFVAAAWLVKEGEPQPASSFGTLFDYDANRHRAFWGINAAGQPVIGVSKHLVDSVTLGQLLAQAGLRDAVMLDSGASTSLAYEGESLVGYIPRPVPHAVVLIPPDEDNGAACPLVVTGADQPEGLL
jgi:biofilm PGA synthesis lipoprotein PgaB